MSTEYSLRRAGREWLVALLSSALLIAPFGCQFQSDILDPNAIAGEPNAPADLNSQSIGLFVNDDLTSDLMAGARGPSGDTFFVYGQRSADGGIARVDTILSVTAGGDRSHIRFANGWPTELRGPEGSALLIDYTQTGQLAWTADIEARDAAGAVIAANTIVIDLTETAAQVAAAVEQLSGRDLPVPEADEVPTAKLMHRSAGWRAVLVALGLVTLTQVLIQSSGQIFENLFTGIGALARATLLLIYAPVFLVAQIFSAILGSAAARIESAPLLRVFITLPGEP